MKLANIGLAVLTAFGLALAAAKPVNTVVVHHVDIFHEGTAPKVPSIFNNRQAEILHLAYTTAKKDGHTHPQLLQGIVLQESSAGASDSYKVVKQDGSRFFGVTQLTIGAARDVLKSFPQLKKEYGFQTSTDEELIAKLVENDAFNLEVASKYLLILKRYGFDTIKQLALAYNQGPGGAKEKDPDTFDYSNGVMRHIEKLQSKQRKT